MTDRVKQELDNIVRVLTETGVVSQIFLFGSCARGEDTSDSDIDLCVLTTEKGRHPIDIAVDLNCKVSRVQTMPIDILGYEKDYFYSHAKRPTSFEHEIAKNGVRVYG